MRVQIPLRDPQKLLKPIADVLSGIVDGLVADGMIRPVERQLATDGAVGVLPEVMKFNLVADSDRNLAAVRIDFKDDGAAREIIRNAAIEAVKLRP